jgi:DNA-binding beta-propeller fold protein YncE
MRRLVPLLVAAGIVCGCSNRERLNPLDPANAFTGGAPLGFTAVADDGRVLLSWQPPPGNLVLGFRLFRRVGASGAFDSLNSFSAQTTRYLDSGLANGVDHSYLIAYVLTDGMLSPAATDVATPGKARPWAVDYAGHSLNRIAPDGRRIAETLTGGMQSPAEVDVDPATGSVWVCDPTAGRLWRVVPNLSIDPIGSFSQPVAVAVDPIHRRVWAADQSAGELQSFDLGDPVIPRVRIPNLATPIGVAVDPFDGSAWVCERTGDVVSHIGFTGGRIGFAIAKEPSRVAVDSTTRRIWVTSSNSRRVMVFDSNGAAIDSIQGLAGPVGIAVDPRAGGRIWVADANGDRVIAYDRNRNELFRVQGLSSPVEIAVDRATGEAWVTAATGGQVVRIAPDGTIIRRTGGFAQPYGVAMDRRP